MAEDLVVAVLAIEPVVAADAARVEVVVGGVAVDPVVADAPADRVGAAGHAGAEVVGAVHVAGDGVVAGATVDDVVAADHHAVGGCRAIHVADDEIVGNSAVDPVVAALHGTARLQGEDVAVQGRAVAGRDGVVAADEPRQGPGGAHHVVGIAGHGRARVRRAHDNAVVPAGQPAPRVDGEGVAGHDLVAVAEQAEHLVVAAAVVRGRCPRLLAADVRHVAGGLDESVPEVDHVPAAGGPVPRRDAVPEEGERPPRGALRQLGAEDHVVAFEEAPEAAGAVVEGRRRDADAGDHQLRAARIVVADIDLDGGRGPRGRPPRGVEGHPLAGDEDVVAPGREIAPARGGPDAVAGAEGHEVGVGHGEGILRRAEVEGSHCRPFGHRLAPTRPALPAHPECATDADEAPPSDASVAGRLSVSAQCSWGCLSQSTGFNARSIAEARPDCPTSLRNPTHCRGSWPALRAPASTRPRWLRYRHRRRGAAARAARPAAGAVPA